MLGKVYSGDIKCNRSWLMYKWAGQRGLETKISLEMELVGQSIFGHSRDFGKLLIDWKNLNNLTITTP